MSRAGYLLGGAIAAVLLALSGVLAVREYGADQRATGYKDGQAAAIAAGNAQRDADAAVHLKKETDLRDQLAAQDAAAHRKDQEYATNLEAAQRRVRAGVDRLRCPAADPVQPAAAADDRPVASGTAGDGQGPAIVPEAAADLLAVGADVAGLVRRYERVVERFDVCRALNEVP